MDFRVWLGVAIVVIAGAAFLFQGVKVLRGLQPPRTLIKESLHDLGLLCLGVAQFFERASITGDLFFGGAVVFGIAYFIYWYRQSRNIASIAQPAGGA